MVCSQSATLISIAFLQSGASAVFGAFAARLSLRGEGGGAQQWLNMVSHRWETYHIVSNDLLSGGGVSIPTQFYKDAFFPVTT